MARGAEATLSDDPRVVYLIDAATPFEARLLREWVNERGAADAEVIALPPSRRARRGKPDARLEACLAEDDDPVLSPLRIAWLPGEMPGLLSLLCFGDPRDPSRLRQRWLRHRHPERVQVVVGEPAPVSDLRRRWQHAGGATGAETTGLADFVTRQAWLALERAERRLRGSRYKVPRFVYEDILARPAFRAGLNRIARERGRDLARVEREAGGYLREIAATHSPYVIDLTAHLIRLLYTRSYSEELQYDRDELERINALGQRHPIVFLPSHKSNLDHLVLQYALHENGHPPNHTAGGINMNFFPMGPAGPAQRGVLHPPHLQGQPALQVRAAATTSTTSVEKRFPLEWYIEGGPLASPASCCRRSSGCWPTSSTPTGAARATTCADPRLDRLRPDPGRRHDYAAEQRRRGQAEQESLGWFVEGSCGGIGRALRRASTSRLGEPLSLAKTLGRVTRCWPTRTPTIRPTRRTSRIQKLAFEVCVRINRVTPITPTSLVTLAMLGHGDRALTVPQILDATANLVRYVRSRHLPTTGELSLDTTEGVEHAVSALVDNGVVTCFAEGSEPVFAVGPDQHLTAAYYRNTIIHFFVNGSIAEVALLRAADDDVEDATAAFFEEAMAMRDLLKFEFFFAPRERFRQELRDELEIHDPDWAEALACGPKGAMGLTHRLRPFNAHRTLRPFLEAYQLVGDGLERQPPDAPVDRDRFVKACLANGKQYLLQRRINSPESVSRVLVETGLKLAANRGIVDGHDDPDALHAARAAFAADIRDALRRIHAVAVLAASRRTGLID